MRKEEKYIIINRESKQILENELFDTYKDAEQHIKEFYLDNSRVVAVPISY